MAWRQKGYGKKYSKRGARRTSAMDKRIAKVARKTIYKAAEKKLLLTQQDEIAMDSLVQGANWTFINDIAPGTTAAQRNGSEVKLTSLRCRGVFKNNQTSGGNMVRLVVGYLNDQTGISAGTDLFLSTSNSGVAATFVSAAVSGLNAMYQPTNPSKWVSLYDRVFTTAAGNFLSGDDVAPYDFTINLKNKRIKFEGNSSGIGQQYPMLYIGAWHCENSDDVGTGTIMEWSGVNELRFTDF